MNPAPIDPHFAYAVIATAFGVILAAVVFVVQFVEWLETTGGRR